MMITINKIDHFANFEQMKDVGYIANFRQVVIFTVIIIVIIFTIIIIITYCLLFIVYNFCYCYL